MFSTELPRQNLRICLFGAASILALALCAPKPAAAQQSATPTSSGAPSILSPAVSDEPADANAPYENVRIKGYDIALPGPADTIEGDAWGLREKLADVGIGWFGYSPTNLFYNVEDVPRAKPQVYSGQRFTVGVGTPFFMTYDLGRLGLGDAQLVAGLQLFTTNWNPSGPRGFSLATLTVYKSFFHKMIELKAGYMANGFEFYNPYIAGNFAAGIFGTSASIPAEVGLSTTSYTKPGANIKINLGHFYDKAGIQAAISPDGTVAEKEQNPSALHFEENHAGTFYINEIGYRVESGVDQDQTWLRAAYLKSTSDYNNALGTNRIKGQYGVYVLGDHQFYKFANTKSTAYRGFYAGFSAMYSPPSINRFQEYYEGRFYAIGAFDSRPHDMISLILAQNIFSPDYVENVLKLGGLAHSESRSATVSYTLHAARGLTFGFGIGYTDHPTPINYTPQTGHAVTLISNMVFNY